MAALYACGLFRLREHGRGGQRQAADEREEAGSSRCTAALCEVPCDWMRLPRPPMLSRCPLPDTRRTATNGSPRERHKIRLNLCLEDGGGACHRCEAGATVDRPIDPDVTRRQSRTRVAMGGTVLARRRRVSLARRRWSRPASRAIGFARRSVERGPVDATISGVGPGRAGGGAGHHQPGRGARAAGPRAAGREARGGAADPRARRQRRTPRRRSAHRRISPSRPTRETQKRLALEKSLIDLDGTHAGEGAAARLARSAARQRPAAGQARDCCRRTCSASRARHQSGRHRAETAPGAARQRTRSNEGRARRAGSSRSASSASRTRKRAASWTWPRHGPIGPASSRGSSPKKVRRW